MQNLFGLKVQHEDFVVSPEHEGDTHEEEVSLSDQMQSVFLRPVTPLPESRITTVR